MSMLSICLYYQGYPLGYMVSNLSHLICISKAAFFNRSLKLQWLACFRLRGTVLFQSNGLLESSSQHPLVGNYNEIFGKQESKISLGSNQGGRCMPRSFTCTPMKPPVSEGEKSPISSMDDSSMSYNFSVLLERPITENVPL